MNARAEKYISIFNACQAGLKAFQATKIETSSVYDCTVEDVELLTSPT